MIYWDVKTMNYCASCERDSQFMDEKIRDPKYVGD